MKKHAADLGLDATAFGSCLDNSKYGEWVRDRVAEGTRLGVNSTPTFYINGRMLFQRTAVRDFRERHRRRVVAR